MVTTPPVAEAIDADDLPLGAVISPARQNAPSALALPAAVQPIQIAWGYVASVAAVHLLSLLVLVPWLFSWTGVATFLICTPLFGMLGINIGYHRLLTHKGFVCPKWLERTFALLAVCCLQDAPARWVAIHRLHHQHSDKQSDPHSPLVNFLWGYMGWVMVWHREHNNILFFEQYARDILRDPLYLYLERKLMWLWVYIGHAGVFLMAGLVIGRISGGNWLTGLQLGLSLLVWGVFLRTVYQWHLTWSVNAIAHLRGYRNYETEDSSRNHWLMGFLAYGDGWHNNHHADQRAAAHGHRWWEFDTAYCFIRALEFVGLAKNVIRPRAWREKARQS